MNACTPKELCTVKYNDFNEAIKMCLDSGQGCYVAKSDMHSAFRNLPIRKSDWRWLVMIAYHPVSGKKFYFFDKCLPFGASISCSHFQQFSNCVAHIFKWQTNRKTNNYLDDFFVVMGMSELFSKYVIKLGSQCQ